MYDTRPQVCTIPVLNFHTLYTQMVHVVHKLPNDFHYYGMPNSIARN